jgi:hypothetical protein
MSSLIHRIGQRHGRFLDVLWLLHSAPQRHRMASQSSARSAWIAPIIIALRGSLTTRQLWRRQAQPPISLAAHALSRQPWQSPLPQLRLRLSARRTRVETLGSSLAARRGIRPSSRKTELTTATGKDIEVEIIERGSPAPRKRGSTWPSRPPPPAT